MLTHYESVTRHRHGTDPDDPRLRTRCAGCGETATWCECEGDSDE